MADEITPRQAVLSVYQALEGTSEDGDIRLKLSNADRARRGAFRYSEGSNREPDLPRLVEDFGLIIQQGDEIGFDELNNEEKAIYEGAKEALRIAIEDEQNTLSSKYISDEKEALAKVTAQAAVYSKENFDLDEANVAETLTNGETEEQFRLVQGAYQCFLLYNIEAFAEQHRILLSNEATSRDSNFQGSDTQKLSYAGLDDEGTIQTYGYQDQFGDPRVYLIEENIDGSEVIPRALMKKGYKDLLTIKTHETAHLSPLLRIYKIYRRTETSKMVEFDFDGKTNLDGLAKALTVEHPNNTVLQYRNKGHQSDLKASLPRLLNIP